jgi:2'-5' RNA ligase
LGVRCFLAVDVDEPDLAEALGRVQAVLEGTGADLKCVETENIHLTMRFLGDVVEGLLEELVSLVEGVSFGPFRMELRGVGAFPNLRRPRVIWTGITRGADELKGIFDTLESRLAGIGFRPERRGFSPHITLARVRSGRNREQLVREIMSHADDEFGGMEVKHVRLKKSVLTPRGPIYSTLAQSTP